MTYLSRYSRRWFSQKKYFPNGSLFFSNLQTSKYSFFWNKYKCIKMPSSWISLKKIPRPSNLHMTYLSRYSRRWHSQKKYFPNGSIFFSNLQTSKYRFFWNKYKCIKMPTGWISLKKIPRPSNLHMTYLARYSRRWYSQKKKIPNRSILFSNLQTSKYWVFLEQT